MYKLKTWMYVFRRSATDPLYYNDILKTNFWFSLKYFFVLLFIVSLIPTAGFVYSVGKIVPHIDTYVEQGKRLVKEAYPDDLVLTILNGKLYTNVKEPYYIDTLPNAGNLMKGSDYKHFITINTQGVIDNYPQYQTLILVTQDAIIYPSRSSTNKLSQPQVFFFNQIKQNGTLNKRAYLEIVSRLEPFAKYVKPIFIGLLITGVVLLPLSITSVMFAGKLVHTLVLAFGVYIMSRLMRAGLTYQESYKMSLHGLTLPIITTTVLDFFKVQHSYVYSALFFLFITVVLSKISREEAFKK